MNYFQKIKAKMPPKIDKKPNAKHRQQGKMTALQRDAVKQERDEGVKVRREKHYREMAVELLRLNNRELRTKIVDLVADTIGGFEKYSCPPTRMTYLMEDQLIMLTLCRYHSCYSYRSRYNFCTCKILPNINKEIPADKWNSLQADFQAAYPELLSSLDFEQSRIFSYVPRIAVDFVMKDAINIGSLFP